MTTNRALRALKSGNPQEAADICNAVLKFNPNDIDALHILGCAFMATRQLDQAAAYLERALRQRLLHPDVLYNYGCCLLLMGNFPEAATRFRMSAAINPKRAELWNNIGYCANMVGNLEEAEDAYRRAVEIEPKKVETWCNLGNLLKDTSRFDQALEAYQKAASINPRFPGVWIGQMLTLIYPDNITPDDMFARLKHLGEQITKDIVPLPPRTTKRDDGVIRVGWHTSDVYKTHPVARNLAPFFETSREGLEYYLYLDIKIPDATTEWFASRANKAINVRGVPDKVVAEKIWSDEIDVMIYLAGRLDDNRPQIAAYRPAPVNVSMYDVATSAIPGMDYFVADAEMVASEERFTEKLLPLPNVYIHEPIPTAPPVAPAPRLANGYTTFGCFNNPVKIGPRTLKLWDRILKDVPNSRLLLHYKDLYGMPLVQNRILAGLPNVERERITFSTGDLPNSNHLARYAAVDVALDPFPVNGSTTTFEALHQGVPVLTLRGNTVVSRWGSALVGRVAPEFVAEDEDDYWGLAVQWADGEIYRDAIRRSLLASPICQTGSTVRDFEDALKKIAS
jgi:tetratricopeptide (TPR) repeat protein